MLRHSLHRNFLTTVVAVLLAAAPLHAKVIEQIIAVIDGEPFTLSSIGVYAKSKMAREFPTGSLEAINTSDQEVLEQFITEKLLDAEIREAGIKISDQEIDAYIDQIKQKNRLTDDELKTALAREGQTLATYKASVRAELEKNELINRQVRKKVNITNEDVERYYKQNAKSFRAEDRARIRHILLPLPENASAAEVQDVTAKINELYKQITAGEDFATLAQKYSEGAGRESGGEIGWVNRGTLLKPIEDVAFEKLSVGEVSQPVRSSMGIHLVKLENRDTGALLPLSAVAPKIKEELYGKAIEERFNKWLKTDLRRKHAIDVKIAGVVFKPEDSKEETMGSLMAKSTSGSRKQERGVLSYLNPFSYIVKETPFEDDEQKGPFAGKSVVSIFGVPMFVTDTPDNVTDVLAEPAAADTSDAKKSGGLLGSLNPFK